MKPHANFIPPHLMDAVAHMLHTPVAGMSPITGGKNSRVYKAISGTGQRYLVKFYFRGAEDLRDRLTTEFASLSFLKANQMTSIPAPIAASPTQGFAVYEFIKGVPYTNQNIGVREVDQALGFIRTLKGLKNAPGAKQLPWAADACFSPRDFIRQIEERLGRLKKVDLPPGMADELNAFLNFKFEPCRLKMMRWLEGRATDLSDSNPPMFQSATLSPSDFGFHNALQQHQEIFFLDFEYFGWDDPAKLTVDFLLHPAMALSPKLKKQFVAGMLGIFEADPMLRKRVAVYYPLAALKWCMICLNEFLPGPRRRREFADMGQTMAQTAQKRQLFKAQKLIDQVMSEYDRFPYYDWF